MVAKDKKDSKKKKASARTVVWGCWIERKNAWLMTPDGFVFNTPHRGVAEATSEMSRKWYGKCAEVRQILDDGSPGEVERG
jgi:hypothetical protein